MNRLQKKCMVFSLSLHGLLAVILLGSAGFSARPPQMDLQVMTLIPANIVDGVVAHGGSPAANPAPQPPAAPAPPAPRAQPQEIRVEPVPPPQRVQRPTPRPLPTPDEPDTPALEPKPKPSKHSSHEVEVSYAPASTVTSASKSAKNASVQAAARAAAQAAQQQRKAIENALAELASGVAGGGSPNSIVDVAGIGGGEAFAGYLNVVFSFYYNAWRTPEFMANRSASADARVTIARDGSIISAELVRSSDDKALDRSVEQALRRVTKLPPFPASAQDAQRTFLLHFIPQAKDMSG